MEVLGRCKAGEAKVLGPSGFGFPSAGSAQHMEALGRCKAGDIGTSGFGFPEVVTNRAQHMVRFWVTAALDFNAT